MREFRVLGPLEVVDKAGGQERRLPLGGRRQRALLAMLLVHRGESVSSDRLVEALWGERVPATAVKIVQGYVSQLRRLLGDGLLLTEGGGYLLRTRPGQVDVEQFEALVSEGRAALEDGDAAGAAPRLVEALSLWRGPPLADLAYESFAQAEIARLEEARLAALEDRIEAELSLGAQGRLVGELETLVREQPRRERLLAQLMLALYRSGRQAEALEAYRRSRQLLVSELGIEPGRDLQALERSILSQDPALDPPALTGRRVPLPTRAGSRRGGVLIAGGGAVLLAAIVAVVFQLSAGGAASVLAAPNSVAVVDPATNRVSRVVAVGDTPTAVVVGEGAVWVLDANDETISKLDARTGAALAHFPSGGSPTDLAFGAGALWVATASFTLERIDPGTKIAVPIRLPRSPNVHAVGLASWVAASGRDVWATGNAAVMRVSPRSLSVTFRSRNCCGGIAIGGGAVWLADDSGLLELDSATGRTMTHVPLGFTPGSVAFEKQYVWVADPSGSQVWAIDPRTGKLGGSVTVGRHPDGIAIEDGAVWVTSTDGTVSRIDPLSFRVVDQIKVGGTPAGIAASRGAVWVTVD